MIERIQNSLENIIPEGDQKIPLDDLGFSTRFDTEPIFEGILTPVKTNVKKATEEMSKESENFVTKMTENSQKLATEADTLASKLGSSFSKLASLLRLLQNLTGGGRDRTNSRAP